MDMNIKMTKIAILADVHFGVRNDNLTILKNFQDGFEKFLS